MAWTYNPGMSQAENARWAAYNAQRVPETEGNLGLQGSTQVRGPGGQMTTTSQYGPDPNALAEAAAAREDKYGAAAAERASRLRQQEGAADLARREAANDRARASMLSSFQSFSGGGAGASGGGAVPAFDEPGARQAAFARAKEQSAQVAQASLAGLRNALSRRGITGGGYAQMRTAEALAPAADRLQDFTREQLLQDLTRGADVSDRERAAGLTERAQNIGAQQSLLGLISGSGRLY